MRLRRRRKNLTERLRPFHQRDEPPEPMVSTDAIRTFLFRWMIETGDPVDVIAKGFDLDELIVSEILDGSCRRVPRRTASDVNRRIGLDESAALDG